MDLSVIGIIFSLLALLISFYTYYHLNTALKNATSGGDNFTSRPLQLQAYERLVMLSERIALPNLVSRVNQAGLSAKEMQQLLLESIKQEYEFNATQQIYVSPVAWEAVTSLRDQNMLIIHQVASTLPPEATGTDFNKRIMEYTMTQKIGTLHKVVLEALNYEAKKIMR